MPCSIRLRPDAWAALFPGDTPVRVNEVPDWSDRQWRSFDAAAADQLGKAVVTATATLSPVTPPSPSGHPLTRAITALATRELPPDRQGPRGDRGEKIPIDDERLTAALDRRTGSLPPREAPSAGGAALDPSALLAAFHAVRGYYTRPEAQTAYQEAPTTASAPMPVPGAEFHERVAHLGDHPAPCAPSAW
ncbi:hypothetical protein [Microbacterium elymi]|uniref:Uncharacterized protein n=1 Tax=Microbacterium elymi TaxID=2909587 RepID=A0ABY5NJ26_9MICO|nr:hypothetical protein [Microbacterium elymi]UUT35131.1 hypothetical protein L2X98_33290 [Microbacterium elymi]